MPGAMRSSRLFLPLLMILSLLFAQQAGAAHAIHHQWQRSQQQEKHGTHEPACEKCAQYAQLGSALKTSLFDLPLVAARGETAVFYPPAFVTVHIPAVLARGPPLILRKDV